MCLLWSKNGVFISQKTEFFIVTALETSNLRQKPTHLRNIPLHIYVGTNEINETFHFQWYFKMTHFWLHPVHLKATLTITCDIEVHVLSAKNVQMLLRVVANAIRARSIGSYCYVICLSRRRKTNDFYPTCIDDVKHKISKHNTAMLSGHIWPDNNQKSILYGLRVALSNVVMIYHGNINVLERPLQICSIPIYVWPECLLVWLVTELSDPQLLRYIN
jgi:hypothetical protein